MGHLQREKRIVRSRIANQTLENRKILRELRVQKVTRFVKGSRLMQRGYDYKPDISCKTNPNEPTRRTPNEPIQVKPPENGDDIDRIEKKTIKTIDGRKRRWMV